MEAPIATAMYEEGSNWPPARTLAEESGVSRPSVRVALKILIAKQVLEALQGDVYYVSVKPQQDFLQSWQELLGKHTN
ncbi:GntR family transcriptional regulator, partial [Neisseria sp. P0015.S009]|uniref:GntR family transcriptional regulator n=1 Tax=Neisseria sp. P0015.S009 TaxID=3436765 RepID=UPI003F809002